MKSKILFLSTLTLGLAAVVAGGMAPKQAVRARAELDPSKTYVDHYLARYVNQDDIPVSSSGANFTIPSFDPTSTLTFTGNYGKYEANHSAFRLGSYGSASELPETTSKSINNAESGVFKEIYDDIKTIATNKYNVAMVSDQYIENIQDIAIFWNELPENSAAAKSYLRIVYLTDDSDTWKVLLRDDGEGNPWEAYNNYNYASTHGGTGVAGYNNHVAFAGNVQGNAPKADGDFATNLKGKNARIGIVIGTNNSAYNFYYYITAIMINRSQSIKSYIDFLDRFGWVCSAMSEEGNNYRTFLEMGSRKMLTEQADALNVACTLTNGREATYYDQFNYFYSHAFGTSLPTAPSSRLLANGIFRSGASAVVLVSTLTVVVIGFGAYFILRKKRA